MSVDSGSGRDLEVLSLRDERGQPYYPFSDL